MKFNLFNFKSVLLICSVIAFNGVAETIEIYGEENYPPFSNETATGLSNQLIVSAFKTQGISVKFVMMPFARVIYHLENNNGLAGFNIIKNNNSANNYIFPKQAIYNVSTHYFYNVDRPLSLKELADLDQKSIVVGEVNGFMYEDDFIKRKFTRHKVDSEEQLISMLLHKRIDAAYITKEAVYHFNKRKYKVSGKISFLTDIGENIVPLYLAFNTKHAKSQYYADAFDQGLTSIKNTGVYDKIVNEFFVKDITKSKR